MRDDGLGPGGIFDRFYHVDKPAVIDRAAIAKQVVFSQNTFGPGNRTKGVIDHIKKELKEIENDPSDNKEWIDVLILAIDGAWRSGLSPQQIIDEYFAKMEINKNREWPDWRTAEPDKAIEHVR